MQIFYINSSFDLSQNTDIYAQDISAATLSSYDYIINIDISQNLWTSMNSLFSTRSFKQNNALENTLGENNVDISLNIDVANVKSLLFSKMYDFPQTPLAKICSNRYTCDRTCRGTLRTGNSRNLPKEGDHEKADAFP